MAERCVICRHEIEATFLGKIKGTYVRGHPVCSGCQGKYMFDLVKHIPDDKRKDIMKQEKTL